jgi:hypothetical protein
MSFESNFDNFLIIKPLLYMSLTIILLNIIFYEKPKPRVVYTHCSIGKCKNESFKEEPFCYWHHPLRQIFYPIGSEMSPRRSQRIAAQKGFMYSYGTN